jgi:hypothetical protein
MKAGQADFFSKKCSLSDPAKNWQNWQPRSWEGRQDTVFHIHTSPHHHISTYALLSSIFSSVCYFNLRLDFSYKWISSVLKYSLSQFCSVHSPLRQLADNTHYLLSSIPFPSYSEAMEPAKIVPSLFISSLFFRSYPGPFPLITIVSSFAIPFPPLSPMSHEYMLLKALDLPLVVFMGIFHAMRITWPGIIPPQALVQSAQQ